MHDHSECEGHDVGEMTFGLTEDQQLMVSCPIGSCCWVGLKKIGFVPMPSMLDIEHVLRPHIAGWHKDVEVDWEAIRTAYAGIASTMIRMLVDNVVNVEDTCLAVVLQEKDEQTDGAVKYCMRQEAIDDDSVDRFDAWWVRTMEHAATHKARANVTKSVAEFLQGLTGPDVMMIDLSSGDVRASFDWQSLLEQGDDEEPKSD